MADDTQVQTDQREADQTDQTTADQTDATSDDLGDKGQAALKAERDARKKADRELKALQAKVAEFENANKSEAEKAAAERDAAIKRADAAEQKVRSSNARSAVYEAVGVTASPRAIYALIRDDLEFDDDDEPTNVAELIAREKKADPTLFRASAGINDGGARDSDTRELSPGLDRLTHAYATSSKSAKRR